VQKPQFKRLVMRFYRQSCDFGYNLVHFDVFGENGRILAKMDVFDVFDVFGENGRF